MVKNNKERINYSREFKAEAAEPGLFDRKVISQILSGDMTADIRQRRSGNRCLCTLRHITIVSVFIRRLTIRHLMCFTQTKPLNAVHLTGWGVSPHRPVVFNQRFPLISFIAHFLALPP
jgi:hypothetical protein